MPRIHFLGYMLAGLIPSCSGGTKPAPSVPSGGIQPNLAAIAATIETTASKPTDGNTPGKRSPVLDILTDENKREMAVLGKTPDPAYYLAYELVEQRVVSLDAEGGALIVDSDDTARNLDVEVRVGSPKLDNTHQISDETNGLNTPLTRRGLVPFGSDKQALTSALWLETDRRYHEAVSALGYVKQDQLTLSAKTKNDGDFSPEPAEVYVGEPAVLEFDKAAWIERLKRCSARALSGPDPSGPDKKAKGSANNKNDEETSGKATRGTCAVVFQLNTSYFVNSEGSQIQQSWTNAQLSVSVGVKSDDGMSLSRLEQRYGRTPKDLPDDASIDKMIKAVTTDLDALHAAPLAEPYVGPAILEGRAAGVFFHEVFGHRIEGDRQKDLTSGQTFASYVGRDIAPEWLSVYDDPQLLTLNGIQLNGFYRYDNEGVRAQRVRLIDHGKLVGFLMGRNPIAGFEHSNGHGRNSPGLPSVARQGNLVVETTKSVSRDELEKMLISEIRKQHRPYGMIFTDISGGFTNTSAFQPQAFKVNPVMAYRIYPDGRKELVRGIDVTGTPLVALQSIRAASREVETFNGICGAESGWVPVSASAPSLLVEKLEVEKGFIPPDRPPILDPPVQSVRAGGVR